MLVRASTLMTLSRTVQGREIAVDAERVAHELGDEINRQRARVMAAVATLITQTNAVVDDLRNVLDAAVPVLEQAADARGLAEVWMARGTTAVTASRYAEGIAAFERARQHALDAGAIALAEYAALQIAQSMAWGPTPAGDGVARCDELMKEAKTRRGRFMISISRAMMIGFLGRFDEAEAADAEARRGLDEITGGLVPWSNIGQSLIPRAQRDYARAIEMLMEGRARLERVGDVGSQSTVEGMLSISLAYAGRDDEALAMSEESERHASIDDAASQVGLHTGRGLALGHLGRFDEALENLSKAVAIANETDHLNGHAEALQAQAEVLRLAGREEDATPSFDAAVALYRRKGNIAALRRLGVGDEANA
jgi:tetratricopeptide (TPR) repeat protein